MKTKFQMFGFFLLILMSTNIQFIHAQTAGDPPTISIEDSTLLANNNLTLFSVGSNGILATDTDGALVLISNGAIQDSFTVEQSKFNAFAENAGKTLVQGFQSAKALTGDGIDGAGDIADDIGDFAKDTWGDVKGFAAGRVLKHKQVEGATKLVIDGTDYPLDSPTTREGNIYSMRSGEHNFTVTIEKDGHAYIDHSNSNTLYIVTFLKPVDGIAKTISEGDVPTAELHLRQ